MTPIPQPRRPRCDQLAIAEPGELLFNERMRALGNPARWSDPDLGRTWNTATVTDTEVRRRWAATEAHRPAEKETAK